MNWAWIGHQGDYDRRTAIHIAAAEGNKEAPRKFVELENLGFPWIF